MILALLAQEAANSEEWLPQGLYPVDSLYKIFALWAISDLYGWIFVTIVPLAFMTSVVVRAYQSKRRGEGFGPAVEYMLWSLLTLFLLWPVKPTMGAPLFGGRDEDLDALEKTKQKLFEGEDKRWSGTPRILLWGMALHDTIFNQAIAKVRALNARPIGEREYLRIRLAHAVPLDEDLARKSALYWVLCYERALSNMRQQKSGGGADPIDVRPLDAALDSHFPPIDEEEWEALAGAMPEGDLIEDAGNCQGLREELLSDYDEELEEDEHKKLLEALRDPEGGGVQFSDDEYKGYLVEQSVKANGTFAHGLREVLGWSGTDHDIDLFPANDDDYFLYRWGAGAVNWVYDWWTSASAAVGVHVGLPGVAKQTAEVARMLAPSLYGVGMMLVILIFPFIAIAVMAGSYRALFAWYRLYLATAMLPLIWELLTSFELFFAERNYAGLASFLGDGATYAAVAVPFLFAAAPALSAFIVFAAFSFGGGGGGGGGSTPMSGATYHTAQAGRGAVHEQEKQAMDVGVGAVRGAVTGTGRGLLAAGPAGGIAGAAGGVAGGVADGVNGEKNPGHDGGAFIRGANEKAAEFIDAATFGASRMVMGKPEGSSESGDAADDSGSSAGAAGDAAAGGEAAGGAAAVPPVV